VRITTLEPPAEEPVLVEAASTTVAPSWISVRPFVKARSQPFDRRRKAEVVERRGPQIDRHRPYALNRLADQIASRHTGLKGAITRVARYAAAR